MKKPAYDARQYATPYFVQMFEKGHEYLLFGHFRAAFLKYSTAFNFSRPYLKREHAEEITTLLQKVRKLIGEYSGLAQRGEQFALLAAENRALNIEDLLLQVDAALSEHAKHLFLPMGEGDQEELDMERFMRESGI